MKQWYEVLFENFGKTYDREGFTQGTLGECDFLETEVGRKGAHILDIGCGTGRHAIEMARRGHTVVGVDLSASQLERAREKAGEGLPLTFQHGDARELSFSEEFDLAIMLCEGAFPLMETDEMNFRILRNAANALKPGGKLIFTTLNGLFPLFHSVKDFLAAGPKEGAAIATTPSFDLMTFRDHTTTVIEDDFGTARELHSNERYYVPPEITWLLSTLNFTAIELFGARLGAFSRKDRLTTEDFEMLVVAVKDSAGLPSTDPLTS